jgi:hypothetical protein
MSHHEIAALIDDELAAGPPSEEGAPPEMVITATGPAPQMRWLMTSILVALGLASLYLVIR